MVLSLFGVCSVKATPVVVKLLLSETENVKTNAVWAASLALENEQTQAQFVEEGGVPVRKSKRSV